MGSVTRPHVTWAREDVMWAREGTCFRANLAFFSFAVVVCWVAPVMRFLGGFPEVFKTRALTDGMNQKSTTAAVVPKAVVPKGYVPQVSACNVYPLWRTKCRTWQGMRCHQYGGRTLWQG